MVDGSVRMEIDLALNDEDTLLATVRVLCGIAQGNTICGDLN